ncbi:hypothetical protein [Halovivax cerinus]|uniref:Uncharacterized protein n=1 Tax=Halovivax cerinus TaxID=1487865 RepID=A0ABD5NN79_9EURY|nr:hypothetical protein [Halovivax cerinus]
MDVTIRSVSGFVFLGTLVTLYSSIQIVAEGQQKALYVSEDFGTVRAEGYTIVPPFVSETDPIDQETMTIETDGDRVDVPAEFEADVRDRSTGRTEH